MTHRPTTMAFGPGLHVFPGGAIDPGDGGAALVARSVLDPVACATAWAGDLGPDLAVAHAVAAIRELYEEAGVLLATRRDGSGLAAGEVWAAVAAATPLEDLAERHDLVLRTDRLVPLSHWVTPPAGGGRRYDTRFYVAALPAGAGVVTDSGEVTAHEWITPSDALDAWAAGRIALWQPTSTTLRQLLGARGIEDVRRHLAPQAPSAEPVLQHVGDAVIRLRMTGAGGIPGLAVNTYLVGRRRMVVVDPGDPGEAAIDAILAVAAARGAVIVAVALTAPVADHAAGALMLAERVDVPVLELQDGDEVSLGDVALRVIATPGTHPSHLALDVPELGLILVGDIDGPGPARGIPDGACRDEAALDRSRERLRGFAAARRLPAHD
jgi:8-oxo-dGTP pyrophosphatase MutT (NUDIX family)